MINRLLSITFSILFIVSCGGGGGGGGSDPVTPTTPAPTVTLSAEPTSVLLDNTSTLTWSSSNASSCSADWTSQTSTSGSEAVAITSAGNNSFSISCTGDGGSRSASVTVEGYRNTDGVVVDGYISGAEVFIDEDDDWLLDSNENSTTSDNDGKFTIKYANGNLVSIGGTDLDSQTLLDNLLITHKLTGHSDFKAVTPVTSIAAFMEDSSAVNAALGIDSSIDVFTFDPVANKGDGGINDYLYEKGNQLTVLAFALQNITNNLNTTSETTQDYFKAITEEIEKEYTETETKVDIETEAFVTKVFDNVITAKSVTIDQTAKANVTKALSGMLPIIQVKSSDDLTTGIIRFAVSTLQTDIQAIANGTATAETVTSYTEDLLNYIAEDQSIDSGEIAPDINAITDNVTTSEDTEVEINVLLNDSYVTSSPFSLSATNGTNGLTSVSNNLITYSPDADYNGSDSFSYTLTQGDKTSSADVTITIEPVNDAPSIDIASTIQVEENQTAVTTVSVSDVDEDELTLTLGGTDADSFNLSDENVLTFKEAPDYETKDSYALTLSLTDGIETVTKDLSIIILDVNYVFSGKVIDGYINGAEIFIDQNFNLTKDDGEFSATSNSDGAFNIDISDESLAACLQKRPIIAEVPVGAIDSSLGEVSSAYKMILPSIEDSIDANAAIFITPFTSLLSDAVIQGINASNIVDEIDVSEGCGDLANSIAINISNELLQISGSIESSLDISFEDLLIDFIQDNSSSTITETSAQKLAAFFPYFKELSDEFDAELSNMHGEIINTNVIIEDDAISSILSSTDIEEIPLSFNAIYETDPNELGWFIQEKIIANGAKVNSDGQIKHYTCFTNSENCITDTRNLDALRNASKRYTRTSTFLNNTYNPENYNYQLVIEDEQRVDLDINGNPKDRVCIYQNWLYLTPVNTRENFVTNDRYNTGVSDGSNDNDDCSSVLANKNEALFVALVDKFDDGIDFEEIDIRITNPIYQNSTFFENKVNNIYQNRNNLDLDPLIQEIASVPRTFKDIENLRAKLTESSTDQISIFWTKRNAAGQQLESAKIDIKFDKSNDYFEYGTIENSSTGSEYTVVTSTEGQQAINDIVNILYSNSNVFNSPDYLSYAPIFTSESTFAVDENQTDIGTVTAVDGDDDPITFTISGDDISISTEGVLTFNTAPDFETKTSYTATVTASDGTNSTTQEITVNINNVNDVAPVITSVDSFSVEENQTAIGTATATDAEGDDITFSVSGTELEITSAGILTFVSAPDYETKTSYTATVTASDGTNSTTQDITVNVTNVNDNSPVITSSNEYSIEENTTEVGQATATDADGDGIVFSITSDSDISIDSSSGVIYFNTAPDYETTTSHSATITVRDGAFTSSQEITINVNDADEGPPELVDLKIRGTGTNSDTDFKYSSTSIQFRVTDETAISKVVLRLENSDTKSFYEDVQNYTLTDSANSEGVLESAVGISFNNKLRSGIYRIVELGLYDTLDKSVNAIIDTNFETSFEVTNSSQEVTAPELLAHTLTVNDNVLSVHALIKEEDSKIARLYHRGSDAYASSEEIDEAEYYINVHASDTSVGYVGDIVDSSDLIDNEDGTFNVVTRHDMSSNADAEAAEIIKYEIHDRAFNRVEYLPNSNNLVPADNANPIFISDSTFSVDENETGIGTVSARNAKGDALTYSVSGSEVIINETSGVMVFASAPDYESKSTYTVTVTATDGTNSSTQEITININDVREQTIQVSVEANNNGSGNVYVINGTQRPNLDLVKGVTYTFVHPTAHPFRFSTTADGTHGGGTEYTTGVNTGSSGTTIIKVTDNTPEDLYYYCSIHSGMGNGINLIDNAPPEFTSSATFSADENQTAIGTVTATDAEGDAITYSISGSDIEISSAGVLTFVTAPDYETKSSYSATITANDGTSSSTQDITVNINNLNDNSPSFTSNATFSADENQIAIGTVIATDADGDAVTYSVSGSELEITSAGVLTFVSAPDYETKTAYTATLTASDGTNSTTQDITVNVTNVNDIAPEFTSDATFSAPENQTAIGTVSATDAEGDDITFSVSGSELAITSAGVLTFVSEPDYETKTSYTATITASDGTNSSTQDITVNILNNDETDAPVLTNLSFNTTSIDVTEDVFNLVVSINIEDESGIDTSSLPIPQILRTDGGGLAGSYFDASDTWAITSGTNKNGIISANFVVPKLQSTGDYYLWTKTIRDKEGNTVVASYTSEEYLLSITGSEGTKPTITYNSISPGSVDVTQSSASVTVSITLEDASGINTETLPTGRLIKVDGGGAAGSFFDSNAPWSLTSGNSQSGTYEATFTVPKNQSSGSYYLWTGAISDIYDNADQLSTSAILTVAGLEGVVPSLSNPSISVSQVNVINESQSVSVTLEFSDASGIDTSRLPIPRLIEKDSGGASGTFFDAASAWSISSGTIKEGVLSATFNVPKQQLSGSYYLWTEFIYDIYDNAAQLNSSPLLTVINNAAPSFTSNTVFSADENQTTIGTVTATDAESDTLTFSISSNDININSATGVIEFISAPDYESQSSYTATVSVNDGVNLAVTQDITVNVIDVTEAVAVDDSSSGIEDDNIRVDVLINDTFINSDITLTATDGTNMSVEVQNDATSVAEYGHPTIIYSPDANWFGTDSFTYTVSSGGESDQGSVTVTVTSVNDAPTITSEATFSAAENQTDIGTVTATDIEDDTLTYSISGSDISIDSSSGVMTFNSAPDYETTTSYSATVTVSDGTDSDTQDITVNITNANDNSPAFTSNATFSAEENQTAIGTVVASDADGDGIAYSISGSDITIDASSGVIAFVSAPDYETTTSYSATVTASDGSNSVTQDITVNIQNIPDVSGVAYASRYSVMDSDIPNTDYLEYSDNDFINTAQSLTNPSIVTGHVGGDDTWDIFSVSTTSSMYVNLDVIDYIDDTKELRVLIYNSDGSSRETSYTSASIEQNMTVLLPDSGDYLIVVDDLYGSSNYILTLGQRYSASTYEASTDFIPDYISNELIGYTPHNNIGQRAEDNISDDKIRQIEAEKSDLFNLTGETFDRPGVKKFNMRSINGLKPSRSDDINNTNRFGNGSFGIAPLTQRQKDYYNDWSYLQKLRKISSVTIFDFNYEFETTAFSRDPEYSKQWNLERVQLEPALNSLGQDVKDVAVAVIDSGGPTPGSTAWNESNLIDGGYDFIYGNSNSIDYYATSSYSGNKSSHGTHVSTTIAAKNNNVGINGYAVKALNINVFNNPTDETSTTTSLPVIDAILYAAGLENSSNLVAPSDTPIKVINLSLKSSGNILYTLALCSAVVDAYNQGISIVAAAGNDQDTDPGSISYPASCAGAISVGATNSSGNISYYSQQNEYVDISAPGGGSSDLDGDGSPDWILAYGNDSQLKQLQGTSMASPQVAAAIALMYSVDSTLTPARVDNMLANGELTDDRGISGKDNAYGYGELNLAKATRNIQEDVGISVSFGYTSTSFLEFGADTTELTIDLIKIGETSLSFSSLTSSNATGLSYNATSTDAEGFGTYTLFIDRNSIPNGEYSTVVNFNLSDGSKVAVRIYYNVGSLRSLPNIGKVFIGMYDASDDSLWGYGELEVDGSVSFTASDVSPGDYYIVTSTDINDNNTVCEYGELCEYYPRLSDTSNYFTVSDSNLSGYEIYLNPLYKYGGPNAASLSSNSQLSNINNNIAKQKNISGSGKILINSISPAIPDNPSKKGKNPVIPE